MASGVREHTIDVHIERSAAAMGTLALRIAAADGKSHLVTIDLQSIVTGRRYHSVVQSNSRNLLELEEGEYVLTASRARAVQADSGQVVVRRAMPRRSVFIQAGRITEHAIELRLEATVRLAFSFPGGRPSTTAIYFEQAGKRQIRDIVPSCPDTYERAFPGPFSGRVLVMPNGLRSQDSHVDVALGEEVTRQIDLVLR